MRSRVWPHNAAHGLGRTKPAARPGQALGRRHASGSRHEKGAASQEVKTGMTVAKLGPFAGRKCFHRVFGPLRGSGAPPAERPDGIVEDSSAAGALFRKARGPGAAAHGLAAGPPRRRRKVNVYCTPRVSQGGGRAVFDGPWATSLPADVRERSGLARELDVL
jgi:hypothetical protein